MFELHSETTVASSLCSARLRLTSRMRSLPAYSTMTIPARRVAVIGAGISGIVAAAHLRNEGIDVTVYERSSAAGTNIPSGCTMNENP
jgi:NADPH-dependent glutamate synthase beta subunit-like oxidoreductase